MAASDELNPAAAGVVLDALRASLGDSGATYLEAPTRLRGGFSSEIYGLRLTRAGAEAPLELVLRITTDDRAAAREVAIQGTASALGFPAPRIVLARDSSAGLRRPFTVMERVRGRPALSVSNPFTLPGTVRRLPPLLGRVMARLHALDVAPADARLRDAHITADELGAGAVLHDIRAQLDRLDEPALARAVDELEAHRPPASPPVVCHADLHALNLLVDDGEVTAVLDWELATLAEPEFDVARTALILRVVPGEMSAFGRRLVQRLGRRSRSRFVAAYREKRVLDAARLAWFEALHCCRVIVMLLAARAGTGTAGPGVVKVWEPCLPQLRVICAEASA